MPKLGFLKIAALFSINIVITSTTEHPRPTPRRRSLEVNKYIDIISTLISMWRDAHNIYTVGSCASHSDQPELNRAGLGALPGTETNFRCGLQPAVHLPVRGGLPDISTYLFTYILSTYPHIQVGGAVCSPMLEIPPVFALCYLNSIPSLAFSGLERSLWCLVLRQNMFTRIPSDSISRLEKLNHLDLSGQWQCQFHLVNWTQHTTLTRMYENANLEIWQHDQMQML